MKYSYHISVDLEKCIGCGLCVADCPYDCIVLSKEGAKLLTQDCVKCGHCVAICPKNAISIADYPNPPVDIPKVAPVCADDFYVHAKSRRSIRQFKKREVPQEIIDRLIEVGRYTPTKFNAQDVSYVVLRKQKDECERIAVRFFRLLRPFAGLYYKVFKTAKIDDTFFFKGAPLVIVVRAGNRIDGAIAASALEIAARTHGLGVMFSSSFSFVAQMLPSLRRILGINRKNKLVITLVIGYPQVTYRRSAQRIRPAVHDI
ncbi:MAG: nitroreductase family protein [Coriobacteriia bacterium]|nr:nitroreductase family protein [Coriobacteriia bacterium]